MFAQMDSYSGARVRHMQAWHKFRLYTTPVPMRTPCRAIEHISRLQKGELHDHNHHSAVAKIDCSPVSNTEKHKSWVWNSRSVFFFFLLDWRCIWNICCWKRKTQRRLIQTACEHQKTRCILINAFSSSLAWLGYGSAGGSELRPSAMIRNYSVNNELAVRGALGPGFTPVSMK